MGAHHFGHRAVHQRGAAACLELGWARVARNPQNQQLEEVARGIAICSCAIAVVTTSAVRRDPIGLRVGENERHHAAPKFTHRREPKEGPGQQKGIGASRTRHA